MMQQNKNSKLVAQLVGDVLPTISREVNMKHNFITEEDFKRVCDMSVHNDEVWKCVYKSDIMETFITKKSFTLGQHSGVKAIKILNRYEYSASKYWQKCVFVMFFQVAKF